VEKNTVMFLNNDQKVLFVLLKVRNFHLCTLRRALIDVILKSGDWRVPSCHCASRLAAMLAAA